jgi:hypothetical protein
VTAHQAEFNLDAVHLSARASDFTSCMFRQTPSVTKTNIKRHNHSLGGGTLGWRDRSTYRACTFDHVDFGLRGGGFTPGEVSFADCTFQHCAFRHFQPFRADFINCTFVGTMNSAMFWGENPDRKSGPRHNTFAGNDFRHAILRRVHFRRGIDLSTCLLPEGPEYRRIEGFLAKAKRARFEIASWPEEERAAAERFLSYHEEDQGDVLFLTRHTGVARHKALLGILDSLHT